MAQYEVFLNKLNDKFDKDDLMIGYELAQGCYQQHRGDKFTISSLKQSNNNVKELFQKYNRNQVFFWEKIHSLAECELNYFFQALTHFCSYMGVD